LKVVDLRRKRIEKLRKALRDSELPPQHMPAVYLGVWLYGSYMPYSLSIDEIEEYYDRKTNQANKETRRT